MNKQDSPKKYSINPCIEILKTDCSFLTDKLDQGHSKKFLRKQSQDKSDTAHDSFHEENTEFIGDVSERDSQTKAPYLVSSLGKALFNKFTY